MGIWGNVIETEAGSQLSLEASKESGDRYNLSITHNYPTGLGESLFLTVKIPSHQIDNFKSQLRQIKTKYDEWYKIAKANNIDYVKKDIPVAITAFDDMYGSKLSYPKQKNMKSVFFVSNYAIHCIIEVSISGYNTYQHSEWVLTSTDISKILTEIDYTIQHQKNYDKNKNQTIELFK